MAVTLFTDVEDQTPIVWGTYLRAQAENKTFWYKFEGPEGSSMPIIRKDELTTKAGDTIKTDIVLELTGPGVSGDTNLLHGNEEKLVFSQNEFTTLEATNGVQWSERAQSHNVHNLRTTSRNQLAKWLAKKLDNDMWDEMSGDGVVTLPAANQFFAGANTNAAGVDTTDLITLDEISDVKAYAQVDLKIEPLSLDNGDEIFGMCLHPFAALSLKKNSDFKQANREAFQSLGYQGPLFKGAIGMWDGVVLYTNNNVVTHADGTGNIAVARNIFFGAQAATRGYSQYPDWREGEFDYARFGGVATVCYKGEALNVFDLSQAQDASANQAIGSLVYYTALSTPTPAT